MFTVDRTPGGRPRVTCARCGASTSSRIGGVLTAWKVAHDREHRATAALLPIPERPTA